MMKQKAEMAVAAAKEAVRAAQAEMGRAQGAERVQSKRELEARLAELAQAKTVLRQINLSLSGLAPIAPPAPAAPLATEELATEELATRLIESFDALLIRDPSHPAIRTLRNHFLAELPRPTPPLPERPLRLPPPPPKPEQQGAFFRCVWPPSLRARRGAVSKRRN
jgi:hypothetical protein